MNDNRPTDRRGIAFATFRQRCLEAADVAKPRVGLPRGWHPRSKKPASSGVYRTSRADIVHYGGAYGYWDGNRWQRYESWGDYSGASNMVWAAKSTPFATAPVSI